MSSPWTMQVGSESSDALQRDREREKTNTEGGPGRGRPSRRRPRGPARGGGRGCCTQEPEAAPPRASGGQLRGHLLLGFDLQDTRGQISKPPSLWPPLKRSRRKRRKGKNTGDPRPVDRAIRAVAASALRAWQRPAKAPAAPAEEERPETEKAAIGRWRLRRWRAMSPTPRCPARLHESRAS